MRVYSVVYVRLCVRCVLVRMCVYVWVYVCVHERVCIRMCVWVRVRACAYEGIEDALPLGVLSPKEMASLPSCLSPREALKGGLGGFPGLSPFIIHA